MTFRKPEFFIFIFNSFILQKLPYYIHPSAFSLHLTIYTGIIMKLWVFSSMGDAGTQGPPNMEPLGQQDLNGSDCMHILAALAVGQSCHSER